MFQSFRFESGICFHTINFSRFCGNAVSGFEIEVGEFWLCVFWVHNYAKPPRNKSNIIGSLKASYAGILASRFIVGRFDRWRGGSFRPPFLADINAFLTVILATRAFRD